MTSDVWYFSPEMQAARTRVRDAHDRLDKAQSLGESDPEHMTAVQIAMNADIAYFRRFPEGHLRASHSESDDDWDATDAAASTIEGFTPGDPG